VPDQPAGDTDGDGAVFGMVLGQFVVDGFWLIIDLFTGMTGNSI
jgi:hypothetical protein